MAKNIRHTLRTRFGDIVAEFLPPATAAMLRRRPARAVIFASGMPGSPSRGSLAGFFSRKGFWFFAPRYRGSWESGGRFLKISPEKDILAVVDGLTHGFRDAWGGRKYRLHNPEISVIGSSFGGPAAILASRDRRIARAVAISPVIDWVAVEKGDEPIARMIKFMKEGFGEAYRGSSKDILKLKKGRFYSPSAATGSIDGHKLLLFHAKDDRTIPYHPTVKFAAETGAALRLLPRGGHLGSSFVTTPKVWRIISRFLSAPHDIRGW